MGKRPSSENTAASRSDVAPGGVIAIHVIGPPSITSNGASVRLRYRKSEALLYYLATEGRPVSRSYATDLLWTDLDPRAGARNLRGVLTDLRSILGPRLRVDPTSGSITLLQVRCDRHQLQPTHDDALSSPITRDDIQLLLGNEDLLEGFDLANAERFETWRSESNAQFQDERHATRITTIDAALQNDQTDLAIALLEASLSHEPWNEAIAQRLAMLHLQWTSTTRALSVLDDVTRTLRTELDERPHPSTRNLRAIALDLTHDETLGAPTLQGRHREIDELRQALLQPTTAIITLRAAPGTGATRALREAHTAARLRNANDVLWIDAHADDDTTTITARIDTVQHHASDDGAATTWRIILDGVASHPHLTDLVTTLIARPDVTLVMVHAWKPLNLDGETVVPMRGLATPAATTQRPIETLTSPAARLFADAYLAHRTAGDDTNITHHPDFPTWVRASEGHPTTILAMAHHLATTGISATSPHDDTRGGTAAETASMTTFLDTLDPDHARVAMALALHRHGATADTLARTMHDDVTTIHPLLDALIDHGVAYRTGETRMRYRTESGLAPALRQRAHHHHETHDWLRHEAETWLERLEPLAAADIGSSEREGMTRALDLLDDIDASIAFLQRDDPVKAIRLATLSATLNRTAARPDKVTRTLAPLLDEHEDTLEPERRIEARNALAMAYAFTQRHETARTLQEAALGEADAIGAPYLQAQSRLNLGFVLVLQRDHEGAATLIRAAHDIAHSSDLAWLSGGSLINLGHTLKLLHAYHDAIAAYEEGIEAMRRCGDELGEAAGIIGLISALATIDDTAALATAIHALNLKLLRLPRNTARSLIPSLNRNLDTLAHVGTAAAFEHLERVARSHGLTPT